MSGPRQGGRHAEYEQWSSPAILQSDAQGEPLALMLTKSAAISRAYRRCSPTLRTELG